LARSRDFLIAFARLAVHRRLSPISKHILFYETDGDDILPRRVLHGHRDLPRRLVEPPETNRKGIQK
jgi:plasmid stabilization system protein ParE